MKEKYCSKRCHIVASYGEGLSRCVLQVLLYFSDGLLLAQRCRCENSEGEKINNLWIAEGIEGVTICSIMEEKYQKEKMNRNEMMNE